MTDMIKDARPRSRGKVRCSMCRSRIARGTQYTSQTMRDGADIWTYRQCPACDEIASYVADWAEEFYYENPSDATSEWAGEHLPSSYSADMLAFYLSGMASLTEENLCEAVGLHLQDLRYGAREAESLDDSVPWKEEDWAAFTWRMHTSPALHPEGVAA